MNKRHEWQNEKCMLRTKWSEPESPKCYIECDSMYPIHHTHTLTPKQSNRNGEKQFGISCTFRRNVLVCLSTPSSVNERSSPRPNAAAAATQYNSTRRLNLFSILFTLCIHKYFPFEIFYLHFYLHLDYKSMHRTGVHSSMFSAFTMLPFIFCKISQERSLCTTYTRAFRAPRCAVPFRVQKQIQRPSLAHNHQ